MKARYIICSLTILLVASLGSGAAMGMTTDALVVTGPITQTATNSPSSFAGRVGIGIANPAAGETLHVKGGSIGSVEVEGGSSYAELWLMPYGSSDSAYLSWGKTNTTSKLEFWSVGANKTVALLTYDGKFGLGTTTPSEKLHVYGNGLVESNLTVKSSLVVGANNIATGLYASAQGIACSAIGYASYAQGTNCMAYGTESHAEGMFTAASNLAAHAEGMGTLAVNDGAHSEGYLTVAGGIYSHAEGCYSIASNYAGHAEGYNTLAAPSYAHAEGYCTIASGDKAHAEGHWTVASGTYGAHSEGRSTTASGVSGHTEGQSTTASGIRSHAEGESTTASGTDSHAAGCNALATNNYTYLWSDGTTNGSTSTNQFTVYATCGIQLLGGPVKIGNPAGDISMGSFTNGP